MRMAWRYMPMAFSKSSFATYSWPQSVYAYAKRGSTAMARWKQRMAPSCSFWRLRQLPDAHQASGLRASKSTQCRAR